MTEEKNGGEKKFGKMMKIVATNVVASRECQPTGTPTARAKIIPFIGFMVLKITGLRTHFQYKIHFRKYARGPEILAKTLKNMQVWLCNQNFGTLLGI